MEKILIRKGVKADLPTLTEAEMGFCTDTKELFIGAAGGNKLMNGGGNTLVASYTYNANKEVVVSAIDYDTNTFTSVGHGLANGDTLYITPNVNIGVSYAVNFYPTGVNARTVYYVINVTTDTFQLSTTSGGASIDVTTANASVDLTKWHFERIVSEPSWTLSVPAAYRYKLIMAGKTLKSSYGHILPNGNFPYQDMLTSFSTSHSGWGPIPPLLNGDLSFYREYEMNAEAFYVIKAKGCDWNTNTATAFTQTTRDFMMVSQDMNFYNKLITSIKVASLVPANGITVKVYSM